MDAGIGSCSRSLTYQSPIGPLKLVASKDGISALKYLFGKHSSSETKAGETATAADCKLAKAGETATAADCKLSSSETKAGETAAAADCKLAKAGETAAAADCGNCSEKNSNDDEVAAEMHLQVCRKWLDAYFEGSLLKSDTTPPRPKLALAMKGNSKLANK